jgi:3-dehydroquinate dehydratase-2
MSVVNDIAQYKSEHGLPVFDPEREREKLSALQPNERKLFTALFEISRDFQSDTVKSDRKRILVINGVNLNMLGIREPEIYGTQTYTDLTDCIRKSADELGVSVQCVQSNHEGELVELIQKAHGCFDGIVINPGAYTHTSIAILDALKAVAIRTIEVHLSDVAGREDFRKLSYISQACEKTIAGLGFEGYISAIKELSL